MERLPMLAVELIEELDKEFPARCIRPRETPEEAHRYAGKRELVDFLLTLKAREDEEFPRVRT